MKKIIVIVASYLLIVPSAKAELGFNFAIGLPFVSQYGLNYTLGDKWSINAGLNNLSVDVGAASVDLTMPELMLNWHPFGGAFYMGLGLGQETLTVEASDASAGTSVKGEVSASTTIAKLGWMWGKANGGFWFGMDLAYISPSGGDVELTSVGVPSSSDIQDVQDAGEQFGTTAYTNITFARFGYLF